MQSLTKDIDVKVTCPISSWDKTLSPQLIHQSIPAGLEIKKTLYGYGLFATTFFPKDAVLYVGEQIVIPNEYAEFKLVLDNQQDCPEDLIIDTETHTVQFNETERWLYLFDSYMNHSCDPTTISLQTEEQKSAGSYSTVALKEIHPGDEITADYNLFEYDCLDGKAINKCLCGSPQCVGRIAGFRYLSSLEQKARIHVVDQEVLESMSADPVNKFYYIPDLRCPLDCVRIDPSIPGSSNYRLVATRFFKKGDIIYSNKSLIVLDGSTIVVELFGQRKWIDNLVYTVNKGDGGREFHTFEAFQNHSCDPNTYMLYHNESVYDTIALKDIALGDEITCDYECFDDGLDETFFHCLCKSENCRGTVKA